MYALKKVENLCLRSGERRKTWRPEFAVAKPQGYSPSPKTEGKAGESGGAFGPRMMDQRSFDVHEPTPKTSAKPSVEDDGLRSEGKSDVGKDPVGRCGLEALER